MKDEESTRTDTPPEDNASSRPSPYDLLIDQSKKMGDVASKAIDEIKDVLNKEITLPQAEQLRETLLHLTKHRDKKLEDIAELKLKVKKSQQILASVQTVFPMTVFPDSIVVDRTKITIIKRDFFWSSSVISIQVGDILNVSTNMGPLFGSLTIGSRVMNSIDHYQVNYLWRSDATFLKHLIQGYVIAKYSGINTDQLERKELIETLCVLGGDSEREQA